MWQILGCRGFDRGVLAFLVRRPAFAFPIFALSCLVAAPQAAVSETTSSGICANANQFFLADGQNGIDSPCTVAPGGLMVEALYLQDASRVGGTALAVYPMFRIRTGLTDRLEATLDTPSQIAESGQAGVGLYPTTHLGFGLDYTVAQNDRLALALGVERLPPISDFATTAAQAKYALDVSSGYRLTPKVTLQAFASGASSSRSGFNQVYPSVAIGAAYTLSMATQLSVGLGTRQLARRSTAQSFGNVAADQRLSKRVVFNIGLGTTFNPVSNAKAHYLASGFNYRL